MARKLYYYIPFLAGGEDILRNSFPKGLIIKEKNGNLVVRVNTLEEVTHFCYRKAHTYKEFKEIEKIELKWD